MSIEQPSLDAPPEPVTTSEPVAQLRDEHPEAAVGAAFAGGLLLALILKRLAR
ncbi:MAG: hypothetical protein ACRDL5_14095 [Solirubrobacteraceae bacterium]